MAEKQIKLKDLLKGSGFEEIPNKWFEPDSTDNEKGGKKSIDMVLPAKKEIVLQADAEDKRGLTVKWTDGKGYEIADGTSKGKSVKKVTLKYHYKPKD